MMFTFTSKPWLLDDDGRQMSPFSVLLLSLLPCPLFDPQRVHVDLTTLFLWMPIFCDQQAGACCEERDLRLQERRVRQRTGEEKKKKAEMIICYNLTSMEPIVGGTNKMQPRKRLKRIIITVALSISLYFSPHHQI